MEAPSARTAKSRLRSRRHVILALSILPIVGIQPGDRPARLPASFFFACPSSSSTTVRTQSYERGAKPRDDSDPVEVFLGELEPTRPYQVIGAVQVFARSNYTRYPVQLDEAMKAARRLGGDAIIRVRIEDAADVRPDPGSRGLLCVTAKIVRWV